MLTLLNCAGNDLFLGLKRRLCHVTAIRLEDIVNMKSIQRRWLISLLDYVYHY